MSPMSKRIVEISAVTVASTRCLDVMIEWVESTRARISSKSTFTASMAAVKSSMSRSHARTMRFTCAVSFFAAFIMSLSSPTSYLMASKSLATWSMPAAGASAPTPRGWAPRKAIFFSISVDIICNWLETCASKSLMRLVTFFINWPSPPLRRPPVAPPSSPEPPASSVRTRASSFLKRSFKSACEICACCAIDDCNSRDSFATTSEAYFLTSESTWDKSAVEASRKVANIVSVSFKTLLSCSHSASTSATANLEHVFESNASTDSVCRCPACMTSINRF
mmetsp:Transcript_29371/g.84425  ORF Transcript_29371/g.84425 Transcript_29371/m.84425 type:complete len:280 (-) Transcript_29371:145-984(-)